MTTPYFHVMGRWSFSHFINTSPLKGLWGSEAQHAMRLGGKGGHTFLLKHNMALCINTVPPFENTNSLSWLSGWILKSTAQRLPVSKDLKEQIKISERCMDELLYKHIKPSSLYWPHQCISGCIKVMLKTARGLQNKTHQPRGGWYCANSFSQDTQEPRVSRCDTEPRLHWFKDRCGSTTYCGWTFLLRANHHSILVA